MWIFLFLLMLPSSVWCQENANFEKKMHQIYVNSYSKEIDDQLWSEYIKTLNNRSYSVVEGDSLWALSEIFFGDGFFWSKIWSFNEKLTNPHFIKVGQEIRFFSGSIEEAPGIWVEDESAQSLPEGFSLVTEATSTTESDRLNELTSETENQLTSSVLSTQTESLYPGAPAIPPPRTVSRPVLEKIPSSFSGTDAYNPSKYNDKGISLDLRPPVRLNPLFVGHSFIYGGKASDYPRIGQILETENGNFLVGPNEMIYLKSKENLSIGDRLTIMGEDFPFDRNGIYGSVIRYMAQIKITEKLKDGRYRAEVYRSLSDIKRGAWVSQEAIPTFEDDEKGRHSSIQSTLIGGGIALLSQIYGQSDVVYLDGGINQGHKIGDILGIYKRRSLRVPESEVKVSPTPIGYLKIFRVEPNLSSAFILSSKEAILAGDETGPLAPPSVAMKENQ